MTRMTMSSASAQSLEFESLLALVADRAATDVGARRVRSMRPFDTEADLRRHRRLYEDVDRLLVAAGLVPSSERPFSPMLRALGSVEGVDGVGLSILGNLLSTATSARRRIQEADPPCEALSERMADVPSTASLAQAIVRAIDDRGEVRDDASPQLIRLRDRIHGAREAAYGALSGLVDRHRDHLSEDTIPLRGGRLVMMLQAGARGHVAGLTHGRSGSGRSFYFEPFDAVEPNNQLQQAIEDEAAERRRILRELFEQARAERPAIEATAEWVAELDQMQASARFGQMVEGRLATIGKRHDLVLSAARHPLLDPLLAEARRQALGTAGHDGPVVPLDVTLSSACRVLVVTGPNAGGKTVTLKTVGLLALAHQCGLPIPAAEGSRIPFLTAVVATIGDDQDLLADRSTFSGRLLRLQQAWDAAGPDALVLLDELGSGTDPEEGAALSIALLETLGERGGLTLATTHLTRVAASALEMDAAVCAAMAFDVASGAPMYRLEPGPPGGSEALALGRRLGLAASWLERADSLLGSDHRDLRRLLSEVEQERERLADMRASLEAERSDAEQLRTRLAAREAELVEERRKVGARMKQALDTFRRETKERLQAEVDRVRSVAPAAGRRRRESLAGAATQRLFEAAPEAPTPEVEEAQSEIPLTIGRTVRHRMMGWEGTLEKLDRGKAQVRVNGKVFRCGEADLVAFADAEKAGASGDAGSRRPTKPARPKVTTPDAAVSPAELSLIGMRVEEALETLDRFLDNALLAGRADIRVIHGHGTGRLRDGVRDFLRRHRAVRSHRRGGDREGGDGATIVSLGDE